MYGLSGVSWFLVCLVGAAAPSVLDSVAVFPAEGGAEGGAGGFILNRGLVRAGWWRVVVLGSDQAPGVVGVGGEAIEFPFRGSAGVFGEESSVEAEEVFEGFVRAAFEG